MKAFWGALGPAAHNVLLERDGCPSRHISDPPPPPRYTPYCSHTPTPRGCRDTDRFSDPSQDTPPLWFRPSLSPKPASWGRRLSARSNLPTISQKTSHFPATPRKCGLSAGGWLGTSVGISPRVGACSPLPREGTEAAQCLLRALGLYLALKRHPSPVTTKIEYIFKYRKTTEA